MSYQREATTGNTDYFVYPCVFDLLQTIFGIFYFGDGLDIQA